MPPRTSRVLLCLVAVIALLASPARPRDAAAQAPGLAAGERPHFLGLNAYYGELHQHTGYSLDACGLPTQAITVARSRGNDFLALTEHHMYINLPEIGNADKGCRITQTDPHKWQTLGQLAEQYTVDGSFVVLRGFEHTRTGGHLNVFNSETVVSPVDLDEFYSWLAGQPPDVVAQFNHIYPEDLKGIGTLNDLRFFPPVAPKIRLFENSTYPALYLFYPQALAKEWQVSSTGYYDGHDAAYAGSRRNGIFAPDITRANLLAALGSGCTFGNTDGSLAVALVGNGQWMGSSTSAGRIAFQAYAADAEGHTIVRLELVGRSGVIASWQPSSNPAEATFTVDHVAPGDFFYLQAVDSGGGHAWSGSITRPLYPRLQTNPATCKFELAAPGAAAPARTLVLTANDGADAPWQAVPSAGWVAVSPAEGQHLPAVVTVTVASEALAPGTHTASIAIQGPGGHLPARVGVQANIGGPAPFTVSVAPRTLSLVTTAERPVVSGTFALALSAAGIGWTAASSVPWLSVAPAAGRGSAALQCVADLTGYAPGPYTGQIVVMAGSEIRVAEVQVALQPLQARPLTLQQDLAGYLGASDTYLNLWAPATPHGLRGELTARTGGAQTPLLRFDLSQVPPAAQVYSATLSLYARDRTVPNVMQLEAYDLLRPWDEAAATWQVAAAGAPWATPGAKKLCEDVACQPFAIVGLNEIGRWYSLDVTALVQKWVARPAENRGLALVGTSTANMAFNFIAAQSHPAEAARRPRLSLVYGGPDLTPAPTATRTPTPTPSSTSTPSLTPPASPTPTLTPTPEPSPTATPTAIPQPSATPSPPPGVYFPLVRAWSP